MENSEVFRKPGQVRPGPNRCPVTSHTDFVPCVGHEEMNPTEPGLQLTVGHGRTLASLLLSVHKTGMQELCSEKLIKKQSGGPRKAWLKD